jgi:hypothetical protein
VENAENTKPMVTGAKVSKRMQVVMELLHTETNYTGILHTLLHVSSLMILLVDNKKYIHKNIINNL